MVWVYVIIFIVGGILWLIGQVLVVIDEGVKQIEYNRKRSIERSENEKKLASNLLLARGRHAALVTELKFCKIEISNDDTQETLTTTLGEIKRLEKLSEIRKAEALDYARSVDDEINDFRKRIKAEIASAYREPQLLDIPDYLSGIPKSNPALLTNPNDIEFFSSFLHTLLSIQIPIDKEEISKLLETPYMKELPEVPKEPVLFLRPVPIEPLMEDLKYWQADSPDEKAFQQDLLFWKDAKKDRETALNTYRDEMEKFYSNCSSLRLAKTWNEYSERSVLELKEKYSDFLCACRDYENGQVKSFENIFRNQFTSLDLPSYLSGKFDIQIDDVNGTIVFNLWLPQVDELKIIKGKKILKRTGEMKFSYATERQTRDIYDDFIIQLTLGMLNFIFRCDYAGLLNVAGINGIIERPNPATGIVEEVCIVSLLCTRTEFQAINLNFVNPKDCFKSLKGVAAAELHSVTAVRPILEFNRTDKRFVAPTEVIHTLNDAVNLASMPWLDFEALIRELFSKEFSGEGAEVKVTRASKDGGVDAVVFDPDPIKGGKFIIQAKRYTNVVGVSAVRDLYGTLLNEGGNRGILVTTSHFGDDAYQFSKDKPITLLSGSELLHLLKKHGYQARIDLKEAKAVLKKMAG